MKSWLVWGLGLLALGFGDAGADSYQESMTRAAAAYEAGDWIALRTALDDAQTERPYSVYVYRNRILARWLSGDRDGALALAAKAAERGLALAISGHPAFEEMRAAPAFAEIAARMEANLQSAGAPVETVTFAETTLLPEAITTSGADLYVGSVRSGRIFRAERDAEELTLIATAPGGVFDIELRRGTLWAAVNNQLAFHSDDPEPPFAAIAVYDAVSGDLLREVRIGEPNALLGDLELAKDGVAYASDSLTPRIFRLAPDSDTAEVFAEDPRFANLQGIALDEKHHRLFVADYLTGLFTVDTRTGAVAAIANDADAHLGGIDGLYYFKGALIGVQNGTTPQRVVKITLSRDGGAATGLAVIHRNLGGWNEPTHGVVGGRKFLYIATSNWPAYDEDGKIAPGAELAPLRIMTAPLNSGGDAAQRTSN